MAWLDDVLIVLMFRVFALTGRFAVTRFLFLWCVFKPIEWASQAIYGPMIRWLRRRRILPAFLHVDAGTRSHAFVRLLPDKPADSVRIVAVSDTHGQHRSVILPDRAFDVLIHAGDILNENRDGEAVLTDFGRWVLGAPCLRAFATAGNHDGWIAAHRPSAVVNCILPARYLAHSLGEGLDDGVVYYGSPLSASRPHSGNRAFQADVGSRDLARLWGNAALLMPRADVVFTHDIFPGFRGRQRGGSAPLLDALIRAKPLVHICGHKHTEFGVDYRDDTGAVHVNVSATNMFNAVTHPAVVIDLPLSLVRSRHAAAAANSSNGNDSNGDTLLH